MKHNLILPSSRRTFMKSALGGAAASAIAFPTLSFGAPDSKRLKVAVIGAGGRGTDAVGNSLGMDTNTELWAVGDVFQGAIDASLNSLTGKFKERAQVPKDRQFVGMDAYQKVLGTNPDVVILTTPPGFRPQHFAAAVEAGKHIFCEKPVAVDMMGIRSVMESARKAKEKGLTVVCGFCWRACPSIIATFDQLLNKNAIGDIRSYYATYYTGPVKPMAPAAQRKEEWSDVEWQIRNWYNFSWLSGDSLVEQAVHSVDKTCWAMRDANPIACMGNGGRQVPAEGGNIYDHFSVIYQYPNDVNVTMASRQITNCDNENADFIAGTKGACTIRGGASQITGDTKWSYDEEKAESDINMYDAEHVALYDSIRNGKARNDGEWLAHSTMVGIMGRLAAYSGKRVTWDQLLQSKEDLAPDDLGMGSSFAPHSTPQPGRYGLDGVPR